MCETCLPDDEADPCLCECRVFYDVWDPVVDTHVMVCVGSGPSRPRDHPERKMGEGCHCDHRVVWTDEATAESFADGTLKHATIYPDNDGPQAPGPVMATARRGEAS
jgi:hypothetical protein